MIISAEPSFIDLSDCLISAAERKRLSTSILTGKPAKRFAAVI